MDPSIVIHALYTIAIVIVGYVLGSATAIVVGLLLRQSFLLRRVLTPLIESLRPVPPVAIVPFFIIWFGFELKGKLLLISLGAFLIVVIGVVECIDRLKPIYLRVCLSLGGDNWAYLRRAALPAIMPGLIAPLRIALATSVSLAVISEYMGAIRGLGHVLNVAVNNTGTHTVLLVMIVLGMIGAGLDFVLRKVHSRAVHWAEISTEAVQEAVQPEIR
jgi:ABC-type nitrate/sulfonate/bicarbonate transport system permease component